MRRDEAQHRVILELELLDRARLDQAWRHPERRAATDFAGFLLARGALSTAEAESVRRGQRALCPDPRGASMTTARPAPPDSERPRSSKKLTCPAFSAAFRARYELRGELSRGGMGCIYDGYDRDADRRVAIKALLPSMTDEDGLVRFRREALALARLRHPGVVGVHEAGMTEGAMFLVMDLVEGQDLEAYVCAELKVHAEPPPLSKTLSIIDQVAAALSACHASGVLHRDVKPANIVLEGGSQRAVLVDFGLVGVTEEARRQSIEGFSRRLSSSREMLGTPSFMAPEQLDRAAFGPPGPAADVWALTATLFYCLTGQTPYESSSLASLLASRVTGPARRLRSLNPAQPRWLDELCAAGLALSALERPELDELRACLQDERAPKSAPTRAPVRRWIGLGAATIAALWITYLSAVATGLWSPATPPRFLSVPEVPRWTRSGQLTLQGQIEDPSHALYVSAKPLKVDAKGRFMATIPLEEGANTIALRLEGTKGSTERRQLLVYHDRSAPDVTISDLIEGRAVLSQRGELEVHIEDSAPCVVEAGATRTEVAPGQRLLLPVEGAKKGSLSLRVRDRAGNTRDLKIGWLRAPYDWLLKDRLRYEQADDELQDRAIAWAAKQLEVGYEYRATRRFSCAGISHRVGVFAHRRSGALLHLLPGGRYQERPTTINAGVTEAPIAPRSRTGPQRAPQVIPRAFLIGRSELTQKAWDRVTGAERSNALEADLPANEVHLDEIEAWLEQAGFGLRLPSNQEWEYACGAGATTAYFWGQDFDERYAWCLENSKGRRHPVDAHAERVNSFGLRDTSGNLWEWCVNTPQPQRPSDPKTLGPRDLSRTPTRTLRGGSWRDSVESLRTGTRYESLSRGRRPYRGFRVAASLPDQAGGR